MRTYVLFRHGQAPTRPSISPSDFDRQHCYNWGGCVRFPHRLLAVLPVGNEHLLVVVRQAFREELELRRVSSRDSTLLMVKLLVLHDLDLVRRDQRPLPRLLRSVALLDGLRGQHRPMMLALMVLDCHYFLHIAHQGVAG